MLKKCPHCGTEFDASPELDTGSPIFAALKRICDATACPACNAWYDDRERAKERHGCERCERGALWLDCADIKAGDRPACKRQIDRAIRHSMLLPNWRQYETPPADLRAMNPEHWDWLENEWHGQNIVCTGPAGSGKSSLSRKALWMAVHRGHSAVDLSAMEIQRSLWGLNADAQVERIKAAGDVLLDDIDRVRWTPHGLDVLREIINWRHEERLTTHVTCNVDLRKLKFLFEGAHAEDDSFGAETLLERLNPYEKRVFKIPTGGTSYRRRMNA